VGVHLIPTTRLPAAFGHTNAQKQETFDAMAALAQKLVDR
jgi:hypothetical protein